MTTPSTDSLYWRRHAALQTLVATERIVAGLVRDHAADSDVADRAGLIDHRLGCVEELLEQHSDEELIEWLDVAERMWEFYTSELRRLQDRVGPAAGGAML